jgi:hypothetical protein
LTPQAEFSVCVGAQKVIDTNRFWYPTTNQNRETVAGAARVPPPTVMRPVARTTYLNPGQALP